MNSTNSNLTSSPLSIFISYSHQDTELLGELQMHLANLRIQGMILIWYDGEIEAGIELDTEIRQQLESASIILLLISPPFIASRYCYNVEMTRAMQRHEMGTTRVIPIILRPVDWIDTPFHHLKALPKDALPITKWSNRDEAFLDVVKGIRRVVMSLRNED